MAKVSLKKIKEIANKSKEVFLLDLKFVDSELEGICVPVKPRSFEDVIRMKSEFKLKNEKLTVDYVKFNKAPKSFRERYSKNIDVNRKQVDTYIQICKGVKDYDKIQVIKFRERLLNILLNLDMEHISEEGISLWEESGLEVNDYNGLVDLFSGVIKSEEHLDLLEILIDYIKLGITKEDELRALSFIKLTQIRISRIEDKDEKESAIAEYDEAMKQMWKTEEKSEIVE